MKRVLLFLCFAMALRADGPFFPPDPYEEPDPCDGNDGYPAISQTKMNTFLTATATYRPRGDTGQFIAAVVSPAVRASVEAAAQLIVQEAQAICPVDTGALRDSISAEDPVDTDTTSVAKITAGAPYAGYVEYGTGIRGSESPGAGPYPYSPTWKGMAAHPFMRPALDTTRDAVRELFASQIALNLQK